jgi:hypothetical protein
MSFRLVLNIEKLYCEYTEAMSHGEIKTDNRTQSYYLFKDFEKMQH